MLRILTAVASVADDASMHADAGFAFVKAGRLGEALGALRPRPAAATAQPRRKGKPTQLERDEILSTDAAFQHLQLRMLP